MYRLAGVLLAGLAAVCMLDSLATDSGDMFQVQQTTSANLNVADEVL